LHSGAVSWCRKYGPECADGSYAAACTLENPGSLQCLVESGELSRAEAVKSILSCFIRSLLAVGFPGHLADARSIDAPDLDAAAALLREHLPKVACGVDLLGGREPLTPEMCAPMSEPYCRHVRDKDPTAYEKIAPSGYLVPGTGVWLEAGLKEEFALEEREEFDFLRFWDDEDDGYIGWRRVLEKRGCKEDEWWSDECCEEGWVDFLRSMNGPGGHAMIFKVDGEERLDSTGVVPFLHALGFHPEGVAVTPEQLPTRYVFLMGENNY